MKNVPIQKGPIKDNEPTMKNSTYAQRASSDAKNDGLRKSMKDMTLMTPKYKKR